jgi:hypothetical protein
MQRLHATPAVEMRVPGLVVEDWTTELFDTNHGCKMGTKQVFTPFRQLLLWLRLASNPSRSLLPFKLNSHLKSSLEARMILRSLN